MLLVTAVMIAGKSSERRPLALQAVRAFLEQSYLDKELLIINDAAPLDVRNPLVREILVDPSAGLTLGELRNQAFLYAQGQLLIQWDDDDYSHPRRMAYQVSHHIPGAATTLLWQVRCSLLTGAAFYFRSDQPTLGIHGTILHDRDVVHRYPSQASGEDTVFLKKFLEVVVADNEPAAGSGEDAALYVRFYHGANTWSEKHVMRAHSKSTHRGRRDISETHKQYLDSVLAKYPVLGAQRAACAV